LLSLAFENKTTNILSFIFLMLQKKISMGSVAILTGEKKFEHFFLIKNFFWKKKN